MAEPILIVGASGRAAAFSALRAGLTPHVIDLFADADLCAVADVRRIVGRDYPHGFVEMARKFPPMPFMYTGGLENYPDVIGAISRDRPLIGNGPEVLRKVRNPFALAETLSTANLPYPMPRHFGDPPYIGRWLTKPLRGSGGSGIQIAVVGRCPPDRFFQEFIDGQCRSANFRDGELLGVTRQLVGEPWLHAPQFSYCGSIGPLELSPSEQAAWQRLGGILIDWAGLQGLFGIDAIVCNDVPWLIEVNPRYTASVEVVEHADGAREKCFAGGRASGESAAADSLSLVRRRKELATNTLAKAIYYAPHRLTIPHNGPWEASLRNVNPFAMPDYADIPDAGTTVPRGRPVMTIFGRDEFELRRKAGELNSTFSKGAGYVLEQTGARHRR
jgi:predicted ATP-grasp superfamily ATP-dependent carboligase